MFGTWLLLASLSNAPMLIDTEVHTSIETSLLRVHQDHGAALAAQVARLLRWRGDVVRNVQPGDKIRLLYEPGAEPELVALAYRGAQIALRAYRFEDDDGVARYYDAGGALVEPFLVDSPVEYVQITETVQNGPGKRRHSGVDLKAAEGTPVHAPRPGRVNRVNWSTQVNGQCVEMVYTDGTYARFLHLSAVAGGVRRGARLSKGDAIGRVGNTGRSSAPHLHYDLRNHRGEILDPLAWHGTERMTLAGSELARFHALRRRLERSLGSSRQGEAVAR